LDCVNAWAAEKRNCPLCRQSFTRAFYTNDEKTIAFDAATTTPPAAQSSWNSIPFEEFAHRAVFPHHWLFATNVGMIGSHPISTVYGEWLQLYNEIAAMPPNLRHAPRKPHQTAEEAVVASHTQREARERLVSERRRTQQHYHNRKRGGGGGGGNSKNNKHR
jgi:hypothetical protein